MTTATSECLGGELLAEMFRLHGVGPMFGMAGFQFLPFYDAVQQLGLRHFLVNDERTAAFSADAYARVTGRPGVCDGTLGPGATNLITGLVEARNAGIPLVALTGDANRHHANKNMTQEAHQVEILRPAVKELIRVEVPERSLSLSAVHSSSLRRVAQAPSCLMSPRMLLMPKYDLTPASSMSTRRTFPCPLDDRPPILATSSGPPRPSVAPAARSSSWVEGSTSQVPMRSSRVRRAARPPRRPYDQR